jgi:hypothetical protein
MTVVKIVLKQVDGRYTFEVNGVRMLSIKALEWHLRKMGLKKVAVGGVVETILSQGVISFEVAA